MVKNIEIKGLRQITKTYTERLLFRLEPLDEGEIRHGLEDILRKTEKYGFKAIEWYKVPMKIDDIEYDSGLIAVKRSQEIIRDNNPQGAMEVLRQSPAVKKGAACVKIDVASPFVQKNASRYLLQW